GAARLIFSARRWLQNEIELIAHGGRAAIIQRHDNRLTATEIRRVRNIDVGHGKRADHAGGERIELVARDHLKAVQAGITDQDGLSGEYHNGLIDAVHFVLNEYVASRAVLKADERRAAELSGDE